MPIEWLEELATGIAAIDEQHREIFVRFAGFSNACNDGCGKEELARLMYFLEDYTNNHFRDEEKAMLEHEYHGFAMQQEAHEIFSGHIAKLRHKIEEQEPNIPDILELKRFLIRWFIQHIKQLDMAFADFIKDRSANG